jgi:MFS family permease
MATSMDSRSTTPAMVPLACGLMVGAGSSAKLVDRLGTSTVVTSGLAGLAAILATALLWTPGMAYWPLGLWFFGVAVAIGWVMGPATDAVMGAVPPAKAGVASAMNDVARQVSGALGTAIVGSLIASLYGTRIAANLPRCRAKPAGARRIRSAQHTPSPPPSRHPRRTT